jgi:hypothetical protein
MPLHAERGLTAGAAGSKARSVGQTMIREKIPGFACSVLMTLEASNTLQINS